MSKFSIPRAAEARNGPGAILWFSILLLSVVHHTKIILTGNNRDTIHKQLQVLESGAKNKINCWDLDSAA